MKMFVSPVEKKSRGPWMKSVASQPPERYDKYNDESYWSDLSITTKTVLLALQPEQAIIWAKREGKPSKSLSLVLKTKKVTDARLKGELTTVSRIQINVLGKFLNNTLTDKQNLKDIEACRQLNEKMKTVDKVGFSVNIKATAERMETRWHLKRWLELRELECCGHF